MHTTNWTTIISCTYSHEAHLVKSKLESECIAVELQDELTSQVNVFNACAVGGIKVQVSNDDYENARKILIESGYLVDADDDSTSMFASYDVMTSKLPLIGSWPIEKRLFAGAICLLLIIVLPILLLIMPG